MDRQEAIFIVVGFALFVATGMAIALSLTLRIIARRKKLEDEMTAAWRKDQAKR